VQKQLCHCDSDYIKSKITLVNDKKDQMILGKETENNIEIKMPPSQQNVPTQNEEEKNQRPQYLKMKSMDKKTNFDVGNVYDPEDDSEEDNKYLQLYRDPQTFAHKGRTIYLSRHGESEFNLFGKIGGNSALSTQGEKYAVNLAEFFKNLKLNDLCVWTSNLKRTRQTASHIMASKMSFPQLNEINSGEHDGMTYEEIAEAYPLEFAARDRDKLRYRYPCGESYVDVCERLRELLVIMNQSDNLLVISHQAVIRCIVAYLKKTPIDKLPYEKIPLHTVLKVTFDGSRNIIEKNYLHVECVDTFRPQPENCSNDRKFDDAIQTVPLHL